MPLCFRCLESLDGKPEMIPVPFPYATVDMPYCLECAARVRRRIDGG